MRRFLSLLVAVTLICGLVSVFGLDAKAAKRYAVSARDIEADYYVTLSSDKPDQGSTLIAEKPDFHDGSNESELYLYENYSHEDYDDYKEFIYKLTDGDSITHTVTKNCVSVFAFWVNEGEEFGYQQSNSISWEDDGMVWGGLPDTGDYTIELSPVSIPTLAMEPGPVIMPNPTEKSLQEGPEGTVYRLGNPTNGDHIYTISKEEANALLANGWNQETTPGISAGSDGVAIYRLTNDTSGEHLFTADIREKNSLSKNGWTVDNGGNPAFYGSKDGNPVYRLFNPNAQSALDSHHFTLDQNEIKVLTTKHGWEMDNNGEAVFYLN